MAVRDDRSDVKQTTTGFRGPLMVQSLTSAKSKFLSLVPIVCDTPSIKARLVKHLEDNKIQTRNYFAGNILQHPAYSNLDNASLYPIANSVLKNIFFVGCSPTYSDEMLKYIESVLKIFIRC